MKVEEIHGDGMVQVDHPEQFLVTTVEQRPAVDELHVTGVVTPDVNRSVAVLSLAGGRVVDIRTKLGDVVAKGQVLLVINSPDVSQAFADYEKFQADEGLVPQQQPFARRTFSPRAPSPDRTWTPRKIPNTKRKWMSRRPSNTSPF